MEQSVLRFARRILLLHLVLLVLLLAVVFFASREVYQSARAQALAQAEKQQFLLVSQTASGLKGYYDSIFGDLDLLKPVEPDDEDDERIPEVETGGLPYQAAGTRNAQLLALSYQLNGRVAHLAMVQKRGTHTIRPLGKQATNPPLPQLVERNLNWIDSLDKATITPLEQFGDRAFNVIGVPIGAKKNFALIASVPVRGAAKRFFDEVNRSNLNGALLLDDRMTIMAASRPQLIGASAVAGADPYVKSVMQELARSAGSGTALLPVPFQIGPEHFAPSMISVEPVGVLDKQWYVVIASRLSDVDAVVGRLFRRAVFWAVFVALSMTAILVSTAVQLIRNRVRMDRLRHELLEGELRQAREIQLAWLPQRRSTRAELDIATVNQPASRISGDFYNWFDLPDGRTVIVIGDVTGHGMAAAFLMATTQLMVRNTMPQVLDPGRCLEETNRQLCMQAFNGQFVTLQILVLDPLRGRVEIGTAGHPPPLVGDDHGFEPLRLEPNLVLGVEKESAYATEVFELGPQSTLLLYTDGIIEADSPTGQQFGLDRLRRALDGPVDAAQDLIDRILRSITEFRGSRPLLDDLTLVAIQLQGRAAEQPALLATTA